MNELFLIAFVCLILTFLFSLAFVAFWPKKSFFFGLSKRQVCLFGMAVLLLIYLVFWVSYIPEENKVQDITVNGVTKQYVMHSQDISGTIYLQIGNPVFLMGFLFFGIGAMKEALLGLFGRSRAGA